MQQRRNFLKLALSAVANAVLAPFRTLLGVEKAAALARPVAGARSVSAADERTIRAFYGEGWSAGSRRVLQSHVATAHECQRLFDRFRGAFPDLRVDVRSIQRSGDEIHVRWIAEGTHRGALDNLAATGRRVRTSGLTKMRIVDGRIVSTVAEWDERGVKAQLVSKAAG
jgi:predicted ester cyclase